MAWEGTLDDNEFETLQLNIDANKQLIDVPPTRKQKLRGWEVALLGLNRCIGSGIFVNPTKILNGTGSPGAALLIWAAGALISTCGLLVWLEWGLTIPLRLIPGSQHVRSVPRSGGEKNYLEWAFSKWKGFTTCSYGIAFILLGNLSGNALAFGVYVMTAAGHDNPGQRSVIPLAIGALTTAILLHVFSRRGGVILNDVFAVFKILLLLAIFIIGLIYRNKIKTGPPATDQLSLNNSFQHRGKLSFPSYVYSLSYVMYSFAGFQQPFYVLSEAQSPRTTYPWATLSSIFSVSTLYILVNVGYLCVVPRHIWENSTTSMAILFVDTAFQSQAVRSAIYALIATCIFGNILVMTFTAARVKQEIAKEGILPWSLFFATARTTVMGRFFARLRGKPEVAAAAALDSHLEQSPMAALFLHWLSSILLIAVTASLTPSEAYNVLTTLYSFVILYGVGFFVSLGLLWMKFRPAWMNDGLAWKDIHRRYNPWINPWHAIIYGTACGALVLAAFPRPDRGSGFYYLEGKIRWWIVPAVALTAPFWGALWYLGLMLRQWWTQKRLVVERIAYIKQDEKDKSQWIQKAELVDHSRKTTGASWNMNFTSDGEDGYKPERVQLMH